MMTLLKPNISAVVGSDKEDAYIRPGDPVGINNLCADGIKSLFGVELQPLQMVRIELSGSVSESRGAKKCHTT